MTDETTTVETPTPTKMVKMLPPRSPREAKILARLQRDTTNPEWLPDEYLSPELEDLRERQRALATQMHAERAEFDRLKRLYLAEDDAYNDALENGFAGNDGEIEDERTSDEERERTYREAQNRLWAAGAVLADVGDEVIATFRAQEADTLLPTLVSANQAFLDREAELLREAAAVRQKRFHIQAMGRWIQTTSDDLAFGRSRHPGLVDVPRGVRVNDDPHALKRHFAKVREHGQRRPPITRTITRPDGDPTGVVFGLNDEVGGEPSSEADTTAAA